MNVFDILRGGVIGEVTQNGKTYATAPTPPAGDDSTKVATTAFVADKTAAIPSGNVAVWSTDISHSTGRKTFYLYAPQGGTWFCWGNIKFNIQSTAIDNDIPGIKASGGGVIYSVSRGFNFTASNIIKNMMALKIA